MINKTLNTNNIEILVINRTVSINKKGIIERRNKVTMKDNVNKEIICIMMKTWDVSSF